MCYAQLMTNDSFLVFRLPLSLHDELREAGQQEDRAVGYLVRRAVREYLDRQREREPKAAAA